MKSERFKLTWQRSLAAAFVLAITPGEAATIFSDNFDAGPSPLWGNESGHWLAAAGAYRAGAPNNAPAAISSLPFTLADFSVDFDINDVMDGGIYLRSTPEPDSPLGIQGVLLNLKIPDGGPKIYWHIMTNGIECSGPLNVAYTGYGRNPHVHIEVSGNTYSAFLNGSATPATTLTTPLFGCGRIALYDFSHQAFKNLVIRARSNQSDKHEAGLKAGEVGRVVRSGGSISTGGGQPVSGFITPERRRAGIEIVAEDRRRVYLGDPHKKRDRQATLPLQFEPSAFHSRNRPRRHLVFCSGNIAPRLRR